MAEPTAELNQLRLIARMKAGSTYAKILDEVLGYTFMVRSWTKVPTSGSAVAFFGPFGAEWDVRYQEGNLANIVHELTHIAAYLGYENDFLCWPPTGKLKPARVYSRVNETGYVSNQEALQTPEPSELEPLMDMGQRIKACVAGAGLNKDKSAQVIAKMDQGMGQFGCVEFDPCVNNVLGWLVEWGYPKKPNFFTNGNNQLYEAVELVAYAQYKRRTGKS